MLKPWDGMNKHHLSRYSYLAIVHTQLQCNRTWLVALTVDHIDIAGISYED